MQLSNILHEFFKELNKDNMKQFLDESRGYIKDRDEEEEQVGEHDGIATF